MVVHISGSPNSFEYLYSYISSKWHFSPETPYATGYRHPYLTAGGAATAFHPAGTTSDLSGRRWTISHRHRGRRLSASPPVLCFGLLLKC